jgi:glycosyltransferase involved in cell wall biosynthesis
MKSQPLVSVVMPTFNTLEFISQAVDSILIQSHKNIELIIVDDGSTDGTQDYIMALKDVRINYHRFESNRGVIFARNYAISLAKGQFIALMDSDDISDPDRIRIQLEYMNRNDLDVCGAFNKTLNSKTGKIRFKKSFQDDVDLKALLTIYCSVCNPVMMMRSHIAKNHLYSEDFKHAEDYAYWCDIARSGVKMANVPQPLLTYRVHDSQISQMRKMEAGLSFQKARTNYVAAVTGGMAPPIPMKLSARLGTGLRFIRQLKRNFGSLSIKASYQIYAEFQFHRNGLLKPLVRLERWVVSIYSTL